MMPMMRLREEWMLLNNPPTSSSLPLSPCHPSLPPLLPVFGELPAAPLRLLPNTCLTHFELRPRLHRSNYTLFAQHEISLYYSRDQHHLLGPHILHFGKEPSRKEHCIYISWKSFLLPTTLVECGKIIKLS